ncbi:MAG: bifunctional UDP-3-O-[3-hydroxymyristoyl] N-acetylglucosamine deacetylase/3-hydroxyacyl-ACP dehydratase [Bacteroidales bacterium]|jgi:UDP-3-O-[3-hydroxymyristoyl] N-acetylglucosamine deacetylase/3-hydroxyacyl-[acyl-carrier-protein] dehydratase
MIDYQKRIKKIYKVSGKGLHTGVHVNMVVKAAPEGHGVIFCRTDIDGNPTIEAIAPNVKQTNRGTVLVKDNVSVSTVEHLMSALYGFGIADALIELDGPEVPIFDGSASKYVELFDGDSLENSETQGNVFKVTEPIHIKDNVSGSSISVYPYDGFSVDVMVDFKSDVLGNQFAKFDKETNYSTEIAPCRTFVFVHDLLPLIENNLIKGGDLENAIVINENRIGGQELEKLEKVFGKADGDYLEKGYLNTDNLKFNNECARHKLLDLIGDLALSGVRIKGRVVAHMPGHKINTETAKLIYKMAKESMEASAIPVYDPNAEPVIDINGIKKLLPHRPPFLMVDRIISMEKETVVGIKTIGVNEGFFIGHFPEEPVMPGVLIIESMAQVGGILVLSELEEPEKHSTYFAKIDNAKFKRKIVPGDVMVIKLHITNPMRRSIVSMKGEVYIGNTLACEADLMAQVIKNK